MKTFKRLGIAVFAASAVLLAGQNAQADGFALSAKAGTLGAGIELTTNIVPLMLNGRIQMNGFRYNTTVTDTNVKYDAKLKLFSIGALADFYPMAGKFRLSGGIYYNGNKLDITGVPNANSFIFNGTTYTSAQVGNVSGTMDFNNFAPYVGVGWGDAVSSGSPLGFNIDLGVMYQGKPKTSISTSSSVAGLAADIAAEQTRLDNAVKNFKFYPVASVGISWHF